ncbi:hypothetical protein A0V43_13370 [Geobacillus sp. JS12]|nr:hypothetical protein A0V43_13370 [Geobacillus sp. JS12]OQP17228.1 hypothetical protein B1693_04330 [Geobacillus zalihae]
MGNALAYSVQAQHMMKIKAWHGVRRCFSFSCFAKAVSVGAEGMFICFTDGGARRKPPSRTAASGGEGQA